MVDKPSATELIRRGLPADARVLVENPEFTNQIREELALRSLRDFIPWATRGYATPNHLWPIMDEFEDPLGKDARCVIHAPPRSAKSSTVIAGLVRLLKLNPRLQIAYISYSAGLATSKSRIARDMALKVGIHPNRDRWATDDWHTIEGGRFFATGVTGELVGHGFDCLVGETKVDTECGKFEIAQLHDLFQAGTCPRVIGWDHDQCVEYPCRVLGVSKREIYKRVKIRTESGRTLISSDRHGFYIKGYGYVPAAQVCPGMPLMTATQEKDRVVSMEYYRAATPEVVYDLQVEVTHNFFASGVLVHNCIVLDDPIRDRLEAESVSRRQRLWDWFWDVCMTRLEPGCGVWVMMHRWHKDDLAGRLILEGWREICLSAVAEANDPYGRQEGTALWESRWPLAKLKPLMRKRYSWRSIYQGKPTGHGTEIFRGVYLYRIGAGDPNIRQLPDKLVVVACGLDLAATAGKSGDNSVLVVMGTDRLDYYVLYAARRQVETPQFVPDMQMVRRAYPGVRFRWHFAGMEKAVGSFLRQHGINVDMVAAKGSKSTRAYSLADDWNTGHVYVLDGSSSDMTWPEWYVSAMLDFTGVEGDPDDVTDASVSAHSKLVDMLKRGKSRKANLVVY